MQALERLKERRPDWAELLQHRYFGGYTLKETSRIMDVPERTLRRNWQRARVVLYDDVLEQLNS